MSFQINFQTQNRGFGSYLEGILPNDIATAAGAFSTSMRQIRNIQNVKFENFAQAVFSLENVTNLTDVNGTTVPVNSTLQQNGLGQLNLGSGPFGTYTMSDFFGCITGLPYPVEEFQDLLNSFPGLSEIYQQLYLAVKWEQATATWDGSSFTYTNRGGGYGRGGAAAPTVTVGGNPATATIGTDPNNLNTYGKIVSISYAGAAGAVVIGIPPDDSTGGWPGMNSIVQGYIDQANALITTFIDTENALVINTIYQVFGQQLRQEQRSRYKGLAAVDIPKNYRISPVNTTLQNFVDSLPTYAAQTMPHMASQTIESIADLSTTGGQSILGLIRSSRNQEILNEAGITLDDNISDVVDIDTQKQLILNGVSKTATLDTGVICGNQAHTIPSYLRNTYTGLVLKPNNNMLFDSCLNDPIIPEGPTILGTFKSLVGDNCLDCIIAVNANVPTGPYFNVFDEGNVKFSSKAGSVIASLPSVPGSLAGTLSILPITLDKAYNSGVVLNSTLDVNEAIAKVIECNCDCWDI